MKVVVTKISCFMERYLNAEEKWSSHKQTAADVKVEIPVFVWSLKSRILSSTSYQMGKIFWEAVSAAVEQPKHEAYTVARGDGEFDPRGWPKNSSKPPKNHINRLFYCFFKEKKIIISALSSVFCDSDTFCSKVVFLTITGAKRPCWPICLSYCTNILLQNVVIFYNATKFCGEKIFFHRFFGWL